MRTFSALVVVLVGLTGCDGPYFTCEPGPWHLERWSDAPIVIAELRVGCGFPDEQIDYRIVAQGKVVLEGSLEHFNRRHEVRRVDGGVEVSIWDRACVVTRTNVTCREIDYLRWGV